jgi:hypothetical protein
MKENFERILKLAKDMIEATGGMPPLFFVMSDDGIEQIDLAPYFNDKDLVADLMKSFQADPKTEATIFCSEAWIAKIDKDSPEGRRIAEGKNPDLTPSAREDREEVIFLLAETRNGDLSGQAPIIRSGKSATVGELSIIPQSENNHVEGRFTGGFDID